MLNEEQLKQQLIKSCAKFGGTAAWAKEHSMSGQYIWDCLKGRRAVGKKILDALNYDRVVLYQVKMKRKAGKENKIITGLKEAITHAKRSKQ